MPYNLDMEDRIDRLSPRLGDFVKKKMFGGVGYMHRGNMSFGIHRESLILRVAPQHGDELLKNSDFSPFEAMTRNPMRGWLLVSPDAVETDDQLLDLLKLAVDYVSTLPKK